MISWTKLIVRNASTNQILDGADRVDALREFRARETMLLGTFERTGGAWETDEPHTWGPQFADDVDWSGFDGDPSYRLVVGERGNELGHVVPVDGDESAARAALRRELRAYAPSGWGRIEVQYPGEDGWRRVGE